MAIRWIKFPRSYPISILGAQVVDVFERSERSIASRNFELKSDDVLAEISGGLMEIGFELENAGDTGRIIRVPVFFGKGGKLEKTHKLDAYNEMADIL